MSKTLNKLFILVVVTTLILSACAAPTTPAATSAPEATLAPGATAAPTEVPTDAPPPTETPVPEPVDLELWVGASVSEAGAPPDDWIAYQIIREKLNINLKVVILPSSQSDQDAKINAAGAANELPDLFQVNRTPWAKLVEAGLVAPVDDLLPLMPERMAKVYNDENRNRLVTLDGQMYGFPNPGALLYTEGLVIRKDWLDKLGLEAPTNLDEFLEVAKAFTTQDPDGNGLNDTYGFGAYLETEGLGWLGGLGKRFDFIYGAYGVAGTWDLNNVQLNARNPNFMEATAYINTLVNEGVIEPDWAVLKKDEYRARWKQGRYGIMHEQFCALICKSNYADFDKNFPEGEWMVLPPPKGPDGLSSEGAALTNARIFAVSQKAMDAGKGEAIARLMEWMTGDEGYYLLGFGEKGVNYNLDAEGNVTTEGIDPTLAYTAKEIQPLTQLRNMVFINSDVELKLRYVPWTTANGRTLDPLALWDEFGAQPWTEATGTAIINSPDNAADFRTFYDSGLVAFVAGQQPLNEDTWNEFLAGLDGLGAAEHEAEAKATLIASGFVEN